MPEPRILAPSDLGAGSPRARRCLAPSDLGAVSRAGANQSLALYALSDLGAARRTALIVTESLLEKKHSCKFSYCNNHENKLNSLG